MISMGTVQPCAVALGIDPGEYSVFFDAVLVLSAFCSSCAIVEYFLMTHPIVEHGGVPSSWAISRVLRCVPAFSCKNENVSIAPTT